MTKIRVAKVQELHWSAAIGEYEPDPQSASYGLTEVPDDHVEPVAVRIHHPGSDQDLQMYEISAAAATVFESHAHDHDEIIVVQDGELILGARVLTPGDSVYVPGNTLYSFKAGDAGLRFLNFRPVKDLSFYTKEQYLAQRNRENATKLSE